MPALQTQSVEAIKPVAESISTPEPPLIPIFRPFYDDSEARAVADVFKSGWIGLGPQTAEFEQRFARYVGAPYVVALNSATAALHLALNLLDVTGGEVITTSMTFVSTNHAILYNGAVPVFADIEPDTLNIDVRSIARNLTDRTRAIVVVHYGGHACDMDPILALAGERDIPVVEDAAHACGGTYKGRKLGSIGTVGCFSFHAVKNLATGDGGAVAVKDAESDKRLRRLRWCGIDKDTWNRSEVDQKYSWYYTVQELGFKCHMNDISAAIGLVQLEKLDRSNARRREIVNLYNTRFADLAWLELPVEKSYTCSAHHAYVVKLDRRDDLIAHLREQRISAGVHYMPNHLYGMYRNYRADVPVTERVWRRLVTLPLYPSMTDCDVERVVAAVRSFGEHRI
ncbi:MAG: DegT/DnrJ/EryC1/StrS family aminotransferase [Chloroflexi bacterium]|nr:DegT/DnrJ/EryC1/StrS family aminotransferase [Chloroflexota bacterium]